MAAKKKTAVKKTAAKKPTRAKPLAELFDEAAPDDAAPTINRDRRLQRDRGDAHGRAARPRRDRAAPGTADVGRGLAGRSERERREIRFIFADVEKAARRSSTTPSATRTTRRSSSDVYKTSTEAIWTDDEQTEVSEAAINAEGE
jgi:hypothetical protein